MANETISNKILLLPNVPVLDHEELKEIIIDLYFSTAGKALESLEQKKEVNITKYLPLYVWGPSGIKESDVDIIKKAGKEIASRMGKEYSESLQNVNDPDKFMVIVIPLHQLEIDESKRIIFLNRNNQDTTFFLLEILPKEGQGIIFLYDVALADPRLQKIAYGIVIYRQLFLADCIYTLPPGFYGIMGGSTAGSDSLPPHLSNRCLHAQIKPSI